MNVGSIKECGLRKDVDGLDGGELVGDKKKD
jgi:hypothetical protein